MGHGQASIKGRVTGPQAVYIRACFTSNPEWDRIKIIEPRVVKALEMLPDLSGVNDCNILWREIFIDAVEQAKAIINC